MIDDKIEAMVDELKMDNTSGANELVNMVIKIFEQFANNISDVTINSKDSLINLVKDIINSQPTMASLINTIGYLISDLKIITKEGIKEKVDHFLKHKANLEKQLESTFHKFISKTVKPQSKIMLISYSSTITNLLIKLKAFNTELFILESRPLFEGVRTAEELSKYFKVNLIIDAAMGKFIDQMDIILIGMDSILKDGSIINKIGTLPLAILAHNKGIDVYVVANSLKYNLRSHYDLDVIIEEKPIEEVYTKKISNENIQVHNYYFDVTPSKYITGIISEYGVLTPREFITQVQKSIPLDWFPLFLKNNH